MIQFKKRKRKRVYFFRKKGKEKHGE